MDDYFTFTHLIGLRDQNLPLSRQTRIQRLQSVRKMVDLLQIARNIAPQVPSKAIVLDAADPEWDDLMPFPVIERQRYFQYAFGIGSLLFFYSYNYNLFTQNVRYRTFRNFFPFVVAALFGSAYSDYKQQVLKVNLFDEYCWLRSQELVKQNEYLLQHEEDLRETIGKVARQANNHHASDFKDSELILQDFIDRYVDPSAKSPMNKFTSELSL